VIAGCDETASGSGDGSRSVIADLAEYEQV